VRRCWTSVGHRRNARTVSSFYRCPILLISFYLISFYDNQIWSPEPKISSEGPKSRPNTRTLGSSILFQTLTILYISLEVKFTLFTWVSLLIRRIVALEWFWLSPINLSGLRFGSLRIAIVWLIYSKMSGVSNTFSFCLQWHSQGIDVLNLKYIPRVLNSKFVEDRYFSMSPNELYQISARVTDNCRTSWQRTWEISNRQRSVSLRPSVQSPKHV
jgi:hypothetical protein